MNVASNHLTPRRVDLLLRGGRVIDPANNHDGIADVAILNGASAWLPLYGDRRQSVRSISAARSSPLHRHMHVHIYMNG